MFKMTSDHRLGNKAISHYELSPVVILALAVSLDGFIEGPNREVDWITFDEDTADELNEFAKEIVFSLESNRFMLSENGHETFCDFMFYL